MAKTPGCRNCLFGCLVVALLALGFCFCCLFFEYCLLLVIVVFLLAWRVFDSCVPEPLSFDNPGDSDHEEQLDLDDIELPAKVDCWESFERDCKLWDATSYLSMEACLPLWTNLQTEMFTIGDIDSVTRTFFEVVASHLPNVRLGGIEYGNSRIKLVAFDKGRDSPICFCQVVEPGFFPANSSRSLVDWYHEQEKETHKWRRKDSSGEGGQSDFNNTVDKAVYSIGQLNCMLRVVAERHIGYGGLFDGFSFWFFKRCGQTNQLSISHALSYQSQAPTLLRAISYILYLAEREAEHIPLLPVAVAVDDEKTEEQQRKKARTFDDHPSLQCDNALKPYTTLNWGQFGRVVLGEWRNKPVAIKYALRNTRLADELLREAGFYHKLKHLQGTTIPLLYYAGELFEGQHFGLCLEPVGRSLRKMNLQCRLARKVFKDQDVMQERLLHALARIHEAGVGFVSNRIDVCYDEDTERLCIVGFSLANENPTDRNKSFDEAAILDNC